MPHYKNGLTREQIKALDIDLLKCLVRVKIKSMILHDELFSGDATHLPEIELRLHQNRMATPEIVDDLIHYLHHQVPKSFLGFFGLGLRSKLLHFLNGQVEETIYLACLKQHESTQQMKLLAHQAKVAEERAATLEKEKEETKNFTDYRTQMSQSENQIKILASQKEKLAHQLQETLAENKKLTTLKTDLELRLDKALQRESKLEVELAKSQEIIQQLVARISTNEEKHRMLQANTEARLKALEERGSLIEKKPLEMISMINMSL